MLLPTIFSAVTFTITLSLLNLLLLTLGSSWEHVPLQSVPFTEKVHVVSEVPELLA